MFDIDGVLLLGGRGDKKIDFGIGCLISWTIHFWCHGDCLSAILVANWCRVLTFGNVESLLPNLTCMSTIQRWQVSADGSCNFIKVGVGCSTKFIQVDNEI